MNTAFGRFAPLAHFFARETGLGANARPATSRRNAALEIERGGRQWLPVSAHITERYLVTYRAPAARLAALVPAPLVVDALDGHGFVSVCALEMDEMGIVGTPSFLRFAIASSSTGWGSASRGDPRSSHGAATSARARSRFWGSSPTTACATRTSSVDGATRGCASRARPETVTPMPTSRRNRAPASRRAARCSRASTPRRASSLA